LTNCEKFEIIKIHEGYVNPLCISSRRHFLTQNINVSSIDKEIICKYARVNIGPSKVYDILKEHVSNCKNISSMHRHLQNYDIKEENGS